MIINPPIIVGFPTFKSFPKTSFGPNLIPCSAFCLSEDWLPVSPGELGLRHLGVSLFSSYDSNCFPLLAYFRFPVRTLLMLMYARKLLIPKF
jgi:hypothetical protein